MARCSGLRRGWAARVRRWSADFSAASKGSALPVSWACCWASRSADSTSTTRFSSRERDRLCISSSSWPRCRLTSLRRVSCSASRADSRRAPSWASRASMRASMDWALESVVRRASSCWMISSFCHSRPLVNKPATASAATPSTQERGTSQASAGAGSGSGTGANVGSGAAATAGSGAGWTAGSVAGATAGSGAGGTRSGPVSTETGAGSGTDASAATGGGKGGKAEGLSLMEGLILATPGLPGCPQGPGVTR